MDSNFQYAGAVNLAAFPAPRPTPPLRNRNSPDSLLEGSGFEISVPRYPLCLQGPRSGQSRRRLKTVTNLARNQGFESISLQRGVSCEPAFSKAALTNLRDSARPTNRSRSVPPD